jgi:hypothetical protein
MPTREELERERDRVRTLLDDARAEKAFIVRQSRVHLSREQWLRYDREIEAYEERLAAIESALAGGGGSP